MENARTTARELAAKHLASGDPLGWFDVLYGNARRTPAAVPWADLRANPHLVDWLNAANLGPGKSLVIGCGLGDDAELLASLGWAVTAFDISPQAIAWGRERFPASNVDYVCADLFQVSPQWSRAFDLIVEIYTLQAMPAELRQRAMPIIAEWVAPRGRLFVFARGRDETDPTGEMPWPLTKADLLPLGKHGLHCQSFEDFADDQIPPVRRFRAVYQRS